MTRWIDATGTGVNPIGSRSRTVLATGLAVTGLAIILPARVLVIDSGHQPGPPPFPDFQARVNECLERFSGADPETRAIVEWVQQPSPDANRHTIRASTAKRASAPPDDSVAARPAADGTPGAGSGSQINWNPTNTRPYADSTPRDPCASLLHELAHAYEADRGMMDPDPPAGGSIPQREINASREENRYRRSQGLPQRKRYGTNPLPSDAIF